MTRERERLLSEALEQALRQPTDVQSSVVRPLSGDADPVTELAHRLRTAFQPASPSATYIARARRRLLHQLQPSGLPRVRGQSSSQRPGLASWRPVAVGLTLVAALITSGFGIAQASEDALPGELLYPAKRGWEHLRLGFTVDPAAATDLRIQFASERLEEVQALVDTNRLDALEPVLADYQSEIAAALASARESGQASRLQGLERALQAHAETLLRFAAGTSGGELEAIEAAIEQTRHSQTVLEVLSQGGNPSRAAPGQNNEKDDQPGNRSGQDRDQQDHSHGRPPWVTPKPP